MLAALASAAVPGIAVAGARDSEHDNATDTGMGIDQAVVQDATGRVYDVYASDTEAGKRRLAGRVRAARTLAEAREPGGLGFSMDHVLAFEDGGNPRGATAGTAVMVATHHEGRSRSLNLLTHDDCASVGTAIGAIHRLRAGFLKEQGYPVFTTGQIRAQLTAWIARLRQAGHIPPSITANWSRIIDTAGLWSFSTCMVHGGFHEGDFLFSGSTITAVTNWQDMQINDPARDLAWTFAKLDDEHRNALITAYGRMMGSRLDDLIMLRANLWLQMEQVGEFIQALGAADNAKIMRFKAQVERLAHQLAVVTQKTRDAQSVGTQANRGRDSRPPSTITVGTLLDDSQRRRAEQHAQREAQRERENERPSGAARPSANVVSDETGETDRTGSAQISASRQVSDPTGETIVQLPSHPQAHPRNDSGANQRHDAPSDPLSDATGESVVAAEADETGESRVAATGTTSGRQAGENASPTHEPPKQAPEASSETVVIPLLEREERALRDAREGLDITPTGMGRVTEADHTTDGTPKA